LYSDRSPVDDAGAQHAHDFADQDSVKFQRQRFAQHQVVQTWGGVAFGVGQEFHQHHAVHEAERPGHTHAGRGEQVQRIDFHALPRLFLGLAAKARALGHRACLPAVLRLAAL
jgi:hypothetical protein